MTNRNVILWIIVLLAAVTFIGGVRATYGADPIEGAPVTGDTICMLDSDYNKWVGLTVGQTIKLVQADQMKLEFMAYSKTFQAEYLLLEDAYADLEADYDNLMEEFQEAVTRPILSD